MTRALGHDRNDTIDVFRAIAILSVMAFHYVSLAPFQHVNLGDPHAFDLGRFGVHLFFIISGLVITMTLERSTSAVDFAAKRFARIYPAYLVAMLATAAVLSVTAVFKPPGLGGVLANLSPYDFGQKPVDPSYWSLTCELHFYLVAAIGYFLLRRRFWLAPAAAMVLGAILALRHAYSADSYLDARFMPLFLIGVGAWLATRDGRAAGWALVALGVAFYIPAAGRLDAHHGVYAPWARDVYILGLGGLLIALLQLRINLSVPVLPWIGRISYSLYLIHQRIGLVLMAGFKRLGAPDVACVALATVLVVGLAWLMFRFVEEPGRKLALRIFHKLSGRLSGAKPMEANAFPTGAAPT